MSEKKVEADVDLSGLTWKDAQRVGIKMAEESAEQLREHMKTLGATPVDVSVHDEVVYEMPNLSIAVEAFEEAVEKNLGDAYRYAASKFFGVELDAVTGKQRDALKLALLGHLYGSKDPHTKIAEVMFEKTGRLKSSEPNLARPPVRDESVKELARAIQPPLEMNVDYGPMEARIADALGLGGVARAVSDAYDREKPYGGGLPPGTALLVDEEHVVGRRTSRMADAPVGVVISRREVVMRKMAALPRAKLQKIADYKSIPANGNHRMRKIKKALLRQILKFLPQGITIDEAMAVFS